MADEDQPFGAEVMGALGAIAFCVALLMVIGGAFASPRNVEGTCSLMNVTFVNTTCTHRDIVEPCVERNTFYQCTNAPEATTTRTVRYMSWTDALRANAASSAPQTLSVCPKSFESYDCYPNRGRNMFITAGVLGGISLLLFVCSCLCACGCCDEPPERQPMYGLTSHV